MNPQKEFQKHSEMLQSLQVPGGLLLAAPAQGTGYNKAWIRDNIYESLGLEIASPKKALKVMHKILDILKKAKVHWMGKAAAKDWTQDMEKRALWAIEQLESGNVRTFADFWVTIVNKYRVASW